MEFNPYSEWLAIPPSQVPPNHYRILGIREFESDSDRIHQAALEQIARLRLHQTGPHEELTQKLMNEVSQARLVLCDAAKKDEYDRKLSGGSPPPKRESSTATEELDVSLPEIVDEEEYTEIFVGEPDSQWATAHGERARGRGMLPGWLRPAAIASVVTLLCLAAFAFAIVYLKQGDDAEAPDFVAKEVSKEREPIPAKTGGDDGRETDAEGERTPALPPLALQVRPLDGLRPAWTSHFKDELNEVCISNGPPLSPEATGLTLAAAPSGRRSLFWPVPDGAFRLLVHLDELGLSGKGSELSIGALSKENRFLGAVVRSEDGRTIVQLTSDQDELDADQVDSSDGLWVDLQRRGREWMLNVPTNGKETPTRILVDDEFRPVVLAVTIESAPNDVASARIDYARIETDDSSMHEKLQAWPKSIPVQDVDSAEEAEEAWLYRLGQPRAGEVVDGLKVERTLSYLPELLQPDVGQALPLRFVNTQSDETYPFVTADRLHLVFTRRGEAGMETVLARRFTPDFDFEWEGEPKDVHIQAPIESLTLNASATMVVFSVKVGTNEDVQFARRSAINAPFGAIERFTAINSGLPDVDPFLSPDGLTLYFARMELDGRYRLYHATRPDHEHDFGFPILIEHEGSLRAPSTTADGLLLYAQSEPSTGQSRIVRLQRPNRDATWSAPQELRELVLEGQQYRDVTPRISPDGRQLYFSSDRPGGYGGFDIYLFTVPEIASTSVAASEGEEPAPTPYYVVGPIPKTDADAQAHLNNLKRYFPPTQRRDAPTEGDLHEGLPWSRAEGVGKEPGIYLLYYPFLAAKTFDGVIHVTSSPGGCCFWMDSKEVFQWGEARPWEVPQPPIPEAKPRRIRRGSHRMLALVCVSDPNVPLQFEILDRDTGAVTDQIEPVGD